MITLIGIYKIESKLKPEKFYIGSAVCIEQRWRLHIHQLRKNKHHSAKLQNHYNKYGEVDLQFSIIKKCKKENLLKAEQFFIDTLNPWFNICKVAGSQLGYKHTEETKKKIAVSKTGKKDSEETKQRKSEIAKGHFVSNETIQKISNTEKGKIVPEEVGRKISNALQGHVGWCTGKHHSEETRQKMRLSSRKERPERKGMKCKRHDN